MPKRQKSRPQASPIHHSPQARRSLTELFLSNTNEIVKLYSSVHRVRNYHKTSAEQKLGAARLVRRFSDLTYENPFTPKISRSAYNALRANRDLWNAYQSEVLNKDLVGKNVELFQGIKVDYQPNRKQVKPTYLRVLHNLESSWLYQRVYYKLFDDFHQQPKIFLELEAFILTHSNQFFMRHYLNYLEGNYVISVRGTGKVYVPHLQAERDSVDLPYTSVYGIGYGSVIADYFEKSMVDSTVSLLKNFREMRQFAADVVGGYKDEIFLHCSQYINPDRFQKLSEEWLSIIGDAIFSGGVKDRVQRALVIEKLIHDGKLAFPQELFNTTAPEIAQFIENYKDDWHLFGEVDEHSAIKRILRRIFVSLIEHAFNRYRMESRGGPESEAERTEYETVFRKYRDMTLLEQRLNCLLVEDGEISLVLLLSNYLQHPEKLDTIASLKKWGLIEAMSGKRASYKYSPRARRLAKWYAKIAGWDLQYKKGAKTETLNYSKSSTLRPHYDPLALENDALFYWMRQVKNKAKLKSLLAEMALSDKKIFKESAMLARFKTLSELCLSSDNLGHRDYVESCVTKRSRFNQELNEFLRTNETISRAVVAIPISTIPTDLPGFKEKIYGFSIFIGTFQFSEGLDDGKRFDAELQEIAEILRTAKTYFTLIGKPAGEVLNQFVVQQVSAKRVASSLGKFAHSLKNEGVSFRAQIDTLKDTIQKECQSEPVAVKVKELEKAYERFNGAIQLLNMTSNPFQVKYLAPLPYCLLDVILQAYCNALDQFLVMGAILELNKMRSPDGQFFKSPILRVQVENRINQVIDTATKQVQYFPNLPNVAFTQPATPKLDAETVLKKEQIFADRLPDGNMMLSTYLEIFNNALQYCRKDVDDIFIDINLKRNEKEIVVEIMNEAGAENLQRLSVFSMEEEEPSRGRGAGVDTNVLFFKNIGGDFRLVADFDNLRASTISRVDLEFLAQF